MFDNSWSIATAIPLILCSVIGLALIAERCWYLLRQSLLPFDQYQIALEKIHHNQCEEVLQDLQKVEPFFVEAINSMQEHATEPKEVRDEAVGIAMHAISHKLRNRMSGLLTVASLAPMLGLLGTIIGLMRSFRDIGAHQGPVEPAIVADGLWQALTTTAVGLVIAVVCLLAHALLASRVRHALAESMELLNRLSQSIERSKG
ncbi:MotA/TolQ/ExbB proton channel family protein [Shewanella sp. A14]